MYCLLQRGKFAGDRLQLDEDHPPSGEQDDPVRDPGVAGGDKLPSAAPGPLHTVNQLPFYCRFFHD